jgi:hypothetical protein
MFFWWDEEPRNSYQAEEAYKPPSLNLAALAAATVPAHGLVVNSRGASGGLLRTMAPWMKRLFGAVGIASMIALGLFVYTEFTGAWTKRGLPSIPISALAALESMPQAQPGSPAAPRGQPQGRGGQQQKLELLNDYVG